MPPLSHAFTGYSPIPTINLIGYLYENYNQILDTDIADNDVRLQESFNLDEALQSLYTILNECTDYSITAGDPIIKCQLVQIVYGLITETVQFQEDCHSWMHKS